MERTEVLRWLEQHPQAIHGNAAELLARCEQQVRQHAEEDAWLAAKAYVEGRMHEWEKEWGFHGSEAYVAREICPKLAEELRRHEPRVADDGDPHLIGNALMHDLEPEARIAMHEWVHGLAADVEHQIWEEIVRLTKRHGKTLVRDRRVSRDLTWEKSENFKNKAAHVAELLLSEYETNLNAVGFAGE